VTRYADFPSSAVTDGGVRVTDEKSDASVLRRPRALEILKDAPPLRMSVGQRAFESLVRRFEQRHCLEPPATLADQPPQVVQRQRDVEMIIAGAELGTRGANVGTDTCQRG
jgi:hypothetical protein